MPIGDWRRTAMCGDGRRQTALTTPMYGLSKWRTASLNPARAVTDATKSRISRTRSNSCRHTESENRLDGCRIVRADAAELPASRMGLNDDEVNGIRTR